MAKISAQYVLANAANFQFNIVKMGYNNYDPLAYYYKEDFPDIEITRQNYSTDFDVMNRLCLVTINGFVYSTVLSSGKLYVPGATKSMLRSRSNSVGVLSLEGITSNVTRQKIQSTMVFEDAGFTPFERVFISVPDAVQKPVLIIGGYIVFENPEYFFRISDNTFVLRLDRLLFVEKLFELSGYRDIFKELDVPVSAHNLSMVDGALVRSISTIRKFLSLDNSFLLDLHVSNLSTKRIYMQHTNVLGSFRTSSRPLLPLFSGYGKLCEYKRVHDADGRYTISTQDAYYANHVFSASAPKTLDVYNDHRKPGDTVRLAQAFFLDIFREI